MRGLRLAPVFLGSLARRRAATFFSFAAIVLGVALGMAVYVVHEAALSEFGRGIRAVAGEADLQVTGPRSGFDENLYTLLAARPEVVDASPVMEVEAKLAGRDETLKILGVDVFALGRVTPALLPTFAATDRLASLSDDALFLSAAAQSALGVKPGGHLDLQAGSRTLNLRIAGGLPGVEERLAVFDIAAVQFHFGKIGRLTRIDLRLAEGVSPEAARAALQTMLPVGVLVEPPQAAENQAARLSRAYRVNLSLLAAMALLTGGFLVFSAQALSVVRRRSEFAFLRAIGLGRHTLFAWLLAEGAVLGLAGGIVGVAVGYGLAWGALSILGGDLGAGYFSGLQPQLQFEPMATAIYIALGMLAGVAGAWLPAREAATVSPAQALKSGSEAALPGGRGHPWAAFIMLLASLATSQIPPVHGLPVGGYLAIACLLAGCIMLLPSAASTLARLLPKHGAVPARLAAARLCAAPGHAVVASAGVLTSVALAAAMVIMVASFRDSLNQWLDQVLPADLYLRAGRAQTSAHLDEALQAKIAAVPGVARVAFTRYDTVRLAAGQPPVVVIARPVSEDGHELPLVSAWRDEALNPFGLSLSKPGLSQSTWPIRISTGSMRTDLKHNLDGSISDAQQGGGSEAAIWISEAVQDIYGWRPRQMVELPLAERTVCVRVAGVWRDYVRQSGALQIDLADYRRLTGDRLANEAAIYLAATAAPGEVADALLATAPQGVLEINYPGQIRALSLRIFDRSFAVTYLLEAVAVFFGITGVAASFAALAAARRREFGMLRHLGLSRRQIGWMLAEEGALATGIGVLGGMLAGGAIGLVLIEVVNRQSFHWSMDMHIPWGSLTVFAVTLIVLASLAAVFSGRQAMRQDAVLAVREDW